MRENILRHGINDAMANPEKRKLQFGVAEKSLAAILGPDSNFNQQGRLDALLQWWNRWHPIEREKALAKYLGALTTLVKHFPEHSKLLEISRVTVKASIEAIVDPNNSSPATIEQVVMAYLSELLDKEEYALALKFHTQRAINAIYHR